MVHRDPAKDLKLKVGDTVDVKWKNGTTQTLAVTGIFADASITNQNWMVDMGTFEAANPSVKSDLFAGARIADGVEIDAARSAIEKVAASFPQVKVQDQAKFRKSQEDQLNQLLTVIYGLLFFAVVIAVLGIMNTLALSVFERTREFGVMRAIGATRRIIMQIVLVEGLFIALLSLLPAVLVSRAVSLTVGSVLASIAQQDLVLALSAPGVLVWTVVLSLCAAIVSAFPASRAADLTVRDAIART